MVIVGLEAAVENVGWNSSRLETAGALMVVQRRVDVVVVVVVVVFVDACEQ